MTELIGKKRAGLPLSDEEITYWIDSYVAGQIPDYQVSALLMAIWFRGMDARETATLTDRMAHSGDQVDLSAIPGIKVDKHSTGGVGDKTTLVVAPVVAACGVPVAKMSGRGLGFTGGTIDKLESIPGFCTAIEQERFFEIVRETGLAVVGQTGNLAPADKKLYALRDVTCTVDNLSLIASSIMSKKLAAGADAIVLDVKTGSGAFMKTLEDSVALAKAMVEIGERNGRKMSALITDMDRPLGHAVGNALEVAEAVRTLQGEGPEDLSEVCLRLAGEMLFLAGKGPLESCLGLARQAIQSGAAFEKFCGMVAAQGGDPAAVRDLDRLPQAPVQVPVTAPQSGWISRMQTESCGQVSMLLGAGRERKEDPIDPAAGMVLLKKTGDWIEAGEVLAWLHTSRPQAVEEAKQRLREAVEISGQKPKPIPYVHARVTLAGVETV